MRKGCCLGDGRIKRNSRLGRHTGSWLGKQQRYDWLRYKGDIADTADISDQETWWLYDYMILDTCP